MPLSLSLSVEKLVAYQREFHALRERLHAAEHRTLQRSSELNAILEQFRRAIAETNGSKDALSNFSGYWNTQRRSLCYYLSCSELAYVQQISGNVYIRCISASCFLISKQFISLHVIKEGSSAYSFFQFPWFRNHFSYLFFP